MAFAPEGHREQDHLQRQQPEADAVEEPEACAGRRSRRAHRLDRGRHQQRGRSRAKAGEERRDGGAARAEHDGADHRDCRQRQGGGIQSGEHRADEIRRELAAGILPRQGRDFAREGDLRGDRREEELSAAQPRAGESIEEPRHPGVLRYVRAPMQGDMDIVDPLIDDYLARLVGSPHAVEAEMRRYADERDGFPIVGPTVGSLLGQLAVITGARRVFEVGSGFGYSAFWFARSLVSGGTVTLTDFDRENLDRARTWLEQAGLADRCRFEAPGDGLAALARTEPGLDIVFLDGEKAEYPKALEAALPKVRPGGLVLADNVLWGGAVARGESDAATNGLREYTRLVFGSEDLVSTIVPIRDGLAITVKG